MLNHFSEKWSRTHRWLQEEFARRWFFASVTGARLEINAPEFGFFAQLTLCLIALKYAAEKRIPIRVLLVSENYSDEARHHDWLSYFFEWISPEPRNPNITRVDHIGQLGLDHSKLCSVLEAHDLFFGHLRVRSDFLEQMQAFCRSKAIGKNTLGVHYRATDKGIEAPLVPREEAIFAIRSYLATRPHLTQVFLTTDDHLFKAACAESLGHMPIVSYEEDRPVDDGRPIHFGARAVGNFLIGKDALLLSLILSQCGELLRTTSFLSGWSSVFNPSLPVTLLNRPYPDKTWFPERVILRRAAKLEAFL